MFHAKQFPSQQPQTPVLLRLILYSDEVNINMNNANMTQMLISTCMYFPSIPAGVLLYGLECLLLSKEQRKEIRTQKYKYRQEKEEKW